VWPELLELWREHDSTGLRAKPKLIHTALAVRVAPKTYAKFSVASETTQQLIREAFGLPFLTCVGLRRGSMPMMVGGGPMLARMAVVRGGTVGLRPGIIIRGLWSIAPARGLRCPENIRRHGSKHKSER
jgi:hypothetical protein